MRYSPLIQKSPSATSSPKPGGGGTHAVGGAGQAGDVFVSGGSQTGSHGVERKQPGNELREYRQRSESDRRMHSRRFKSGRAMLLELRSGVERRNGSRRKGEPTMHIRVKV